MPMGLDFPAWRQATITSVRPSNLPNVTVTVPYTQWGAVTNKQLQQTNGAYVRPTQSVLIPRDSVDDPGSTGPWKPGDTITVDELNPVDGSSSVTYTIQTVVMDDYYWFLGVFNPTIAFGLRDLCDVLVVVAESVSDILTREITLDEEEEDVVCRIQPTNDVLSVVHGRQGTTNRYDVFFAENRVLKPHKHVLRFVNDEGDTVVADIVTVNESERIDVCMRAVVEVRP